MIWVAMSSAGSSPVWFLRFTVDIYQEISEHFVLPSAKRFYGDLISFPSRTCPTPPTVPKTDPTSTKPIIFEPREKGEVPEQ